ncbi:glycosyltransferase family 2 protein [Veillonella criceti]|uniref:Chondroitin polymerase n=1 Tax=Veillonella criceti TaxID=103891 RepID=A0A380NP46_9FIRM|nr:glycosyltransferase family 2 protein [Veillonella criceti]SUP44754.1 Chondroitin polymerase [Veillonella criceti]
MILDLVSIITPCYNGARYIGETIDSVLAQTHTNWEMIIVDDGSKDDSAQIIKEYVEKDPRIKFIQQKNAGSAAARNNGIRNASGQYIALLDADDIWLPDFLKKQIKYMKDNDGICVAGSYGLIDEHSKDILSPVQVKEIITIKDMRVRGQVGCLTGLYDCSKYGKIYLKEELRSLRDDYAYWYDIVSLEGVIYGNPEILAKYRVLSNSTTGNKIKLIKPQYKFYRNYLKEGRIEAFINLIRWGSVGIKRFFKI